MKLTNSMSDRRELQAEGRQDYYDEQVLDQLCANITEQQAQFAAWLTVTDLLGTRDLLRFVRSENPELYEAIRKKKLS